MSQLPHLSPDHNPMKCNSSMVTRHHPYQYQGNMNHHIESVNYSGNASTHMGSISHDNKQYCSQVNSDNLSKFQYGYPKMEPVFSNNNDFTPPNPPTKNAYLAPKSRAANMARYNPYNCAGRLQNVMPLEPQNNPQQMRSIENLESYDQNSGCGQQRLDQSYNTGDQQQQFYFSYLWNLVF